MHTEDVEMLLTNNIVHVVGTGPGSKNYISLIAVEKIKEANWLIGGKRLLEEFAEPDQQCIEVTNNLSVVVDIIKDLYYQDANIAVLVSGDTGFYSLAQYLKKNLADVKFEFIPGISSVQLMFARLQKSWSEALFLSMHGRDNPEQLAKVFESKVTAILTGTPWTPQKIASWLVDYAQSKEYKLKDFLDKVVVEIGKDLASEVEIIHKTDLHRLANCGQDYTNSVMVISYD